MSHHNGAWRTLKTIWPILITLITLGAVYATIRAGVDYNKSDIIKQGIRITAAEKTSSENKTATQDIKADIREIRVEQKYMSSDIAEIKEGIKTLNEKIK